MCHKGILSDQTCQLTQKVFLLFYEIYIYIYTVLIPSNISKVY